MKIHDSLDKVPVQLHEEKLGTPKDKGIIGRTMCPSPIKAITNCVLAVQTLYLDRNPSRRCSFTSSVHHQLVIKAFLANTLLQCLRGNLNGA